ncbi:MAG: flagellar motor switch protein FliN [Phycisphaerales bacterium]|nr:flagellar motor switch protein FliN [Phycisphaerales bacterium]
MSDEEQTPTPENGAPMPEDADTSADERAVPESAERRADGEPTERPSQDGDAAESLDAAQAAVSAALSPGAAGAGEDPGDAREPTSEALEMLAEMRQSVDETAGATGQVLGGSQASGEQPTPFSVPTFTPAAPASEDAEMEMLGDVNVDVRIELGRTRMLVEDVLRLGEGAVVELEKLAGDPVDVYVNGRHVARGEVLVLNENFCVRVNEVIEPLPAGKQAD